MGSDGSPGNFIVETGPCADSPMDCNGDYYGSSNLDDCGVCDGSNADMDCAGTCNGDAYEDNCGICDDNPFNDCLYDCNGVPGGDAVEDNCGTCDDDPANDCVQDCAGVWGGDSIEDSCGVCDGGNSDQDCNSDCFGYAYYDNCDTCVGGNTGLTSCIPDCSGIWGGDALYDNCGICDYDASNDCMEDCAGVWGGNNICGCTDITAINYDSTATFDDGSCNYPPPQTYNYFDTSYNLKHPDLWLDYYEIPVANGLPLNGVDSDGNTFPFWYDAAVAIADFNGDGFEDILHSKTGSDLVTEEYPLELFINDGLNEIFILDSTLIPSNAQNTTAREASIGDFNNDGYNDLIVLKKIWSLFSLLYFNIIII